MTHVHSSDVLASLNPLYEHSLMELCQRGRAVSLTDVRRVRASSLKATNSTSSMCEDTLSLLSDTTSSGSMTPPVRPISGMMMQARLSPVVKRQKEQAALRKLKHEAFLEAENDETDSQEGKSAAVTAALVTFMMAMLSCPLSPCLPTTYIHLSRLPIGVGHSEVIEALRREWPRHDFNIKLHVYQRTRHVSGLASVTPGLIPDELEKLRQRAKNVFLPLASGDKMIVEESKRDSDPHLYARYRTMVLQGLGCEIDGEPPLKETVQEKIVSPVIYLRVMADKARPSELLQNLHNLKQEAVVALLDRYEKDGKNLCDTVQLIAPDKSVTRQCMHRSHFGRAFFLECEDCESAQTLMEEIQKNSIQVIEGMAFSLHVEAKKVLADRGEPGRLFEQDRQKRYQVARLVERFRQELGNLKHEPCNLPNCWMLEPHTMAVHSLFCFKANDNNFDRNEESFEQPHQHHHQHPHPHHHQHQHQHPHPHQHQHQHPHQHQQCPMYKPVPQPDRVNNYHHSPEMTFATDESLHSSGNDSFGSHDVHLMDVSSYYSQDMGSQCRNWADEDEEMFECPQQEMPSYKGTRPPTTGRPFGRSKWNPDARPFRRGAMKWNSEGRMYNRRAEAGKWNPQAPPFNPSGHPKKAHMGGYRNHYNDYNRAAAQQHSNEDFNQWSSSHSNPYARW